MKRIELLTLLAACTLWSCQETYVEGVVTTTTATEITDVSAVCGGSLQITFKGRDASDFVVQETGIAWAMSEAQLRGSSDNRTYVPAPNGDKEGNFSCKLEGLRANTAYYFCAYAHLINEKNHTVVGEVGKFTTLSPADVEISTLAVTGITRTTAVAGGSIKSEGRPPYVERGVCYSASSSAPTITDTRKPATGEGTGDYSVTLTGLTENTTYYARAYAINHNGVAYGETKTFKTGNK